MKNTKSEAIDAINNLDLTNIKIKLISKGFTKEQANITEMWYKRFLTLRVNYPGEKLVPNEAIDEMWHTHVLDTRKYAKDCELIFGEFVHHNPAYGNHDEKIVQNDFNQTNLYYRIEFGADCTEMFNESNLVTSDVQKLILPATSDM